MKLLLHTCCAPCAIYPVKEAKKDGFTITGFFYNPNIHPFSEYEKRKNAAKTYFESEKLEIIFPEYKPAIFFKNVRGKEGAPEERCLTCWNLRAGETASSAAENGFDAFSTTLLGSIYQDHRAIKGICEGLAARHRVNFYYRDFRAGFRDAHKFAGEKGIYRQSYCGCIFSMVEREEAKKAGKKAKAELEAFMPKESVE